MPRMAGRPQTGAIISLLLAAAVCGGGLAARCLAQDLPFGVAPSQGTSFSGRDFGGMTFPQAPVGGAISFAGTKVYTWQEGSCRRMLLSGDVRVRLGSYAFEARRADVWLDKDGMKDGKQVRQVFVYFDEVGGSAAASGSVSISAHRLPVRAMIVPDAPIELLADAVLQARPERRGRTADDADFVAEGEQVLANALEAQARGVGLASRTGAAGEGPTREQLTRTLEPGSGGPIFARQGILTVAPGNVTLVTGQEENALIVSDGVSVAYFDQATKRTLQVTAQRGVVFLDPGRIADMAHLTVENVRGIYLEGDVIATDGQYTLRGPQVYYDVRRNKAVLLDAVFWTYDEQKRVPLYVRADSIRQESQKEFTAKHAVFTNSAFFDPELSIGASSVTISRDERTLPREGLRGDPDRTESRTTVDADNITLRAMGVPVFWWPSYHGDPELFPLKTVAVENRTGVGGSLKTKWNVNSLLGKKTGPGFESDLLADWYFERGVGVGTNTRWESPDSKGGIFAYSLLSDRGSDRLPTGVEVNPQNDMRGVFAGEQRWRLSENWSLLAEGAYISDESYIPAWFEQTGKNRREFTSRMFVRRIEGNTAFTGEVKGSFNDFLANEYLLQSQGYSVAKLPEFGYHRLADDLFNESFPGALTYFSDSIASRMQMQFDEASALSRGMNSVARAQRALGVNPLQSPSERLSALGYTERAVDRFDTRHELAGKFAWGPVNFNPFVVGRVTAYDDDFEELSPNQRDSVRLWSAAGMRVSTTIAHVYENVESRLFDLHRLRHIIEPNASIWVAGTNIEGSDLPIYDNTVEDLADGTIAKFGVSQTFQTQRGGPGRWYNEDVLKLDTSIVVSSSDADPKTPLGRYYDFRPEYSNPGNYAVGDAAWRVTEAFALTGSEVYNLDANQQAMTSAGLLIYHAPGFVTGLDARYINSQDSTIISIGTKYDLTSKYSISIGGSYDATRGGFQGGGVEVRRRFASMMMGISAGYNDISGVASFGFVFVPYGIAGEGRISGVGGPTGAASSSSGGFE